MSTSRLNESAFNERRANSNQKFLTIKINQIKSFQNPRRYRNLIKKKKKKIRHPDVRKKKSRAKLDSTRKKKKETPFVKYSRKGRKRKGWTRWLQMTQYRTIGRKEPGKAR